MSSKFLLRYIRPLHSIQILNRQPIVSPNFIRVLKPRRALKPASTLRAYSCLKKEAREDSLITHDESMLADTLPYTRQQLNDVNLRCWGFVFYRCTYSSPEKWNNFISVVKERAYEYLKKDGATDMWDTMKWTIIEDPETLDGASMLETSQRFYQWVQTEGREELKESVWSGKSTSYPVARYMFFVHVDEENVESVVNDARAKEEDGSYITIVRMDNVLSREEHREYWEQEEQGGEVENMRDLKKRFKADSLVPLYEELIDANMWYYMWDFQQLNYQI